MKSPTILHFQRFWENGKDHIEEKKPYILQVTTWRKYVISLQIISRAWHTSQHHAAHSMTACPVKTQCCRLKNMRLLFTHLSYEPLRGVCNTAMLAPVLINLKMAMLSLSYIHIFLCFHHTLTMQNFEVDFLSATLILL